MARYARNELRSGLKVLLDGAPHEVLAAESEKPGKGQVFTRTRLRNLLTGRVNEKTLKSGDTLAAADVQELELQYLYADGEAGVFMSPETYEQHAAPAAAMADARPWLQPQDRCRVLLYEGNAVRVTPPPFVELEVAETDPGVRGDTAAGGVKPARLATGAVVRVPLFVEAGEAVRVDTRSGEYAGRARR